MVEPICANCWKTEPYCVCAEIVTLRPRTSLLVLQHPQEAKNPLGSARLLALTVEESVHRVGLSWRSFSAALGREAMPSEWAVLFLGPLKGSPKLDPEAPFQILSGKNSAPVAPSKIRGIVMLDGNWKQSKTLWWRNPWLLKLNRIVLNPTLPSRYGSVRKQPRKSCLSTIEAAAETFRGLGEKEAVPEALHTLFDKHLQRVSEVGRAK